MILQNAFKYCTESLLTSCYPRNGSYYTSIQVNKSKNGKSNAIASQWNNNRNHYNESGDVNNVNNNNFLLAPNNADEFVTLRNNERAGVISRIMAATHQVITDTL